jgi:hypothetical protein
MSSFLIYSPWFCVGGQAVTVCGIRITGTPFVCADGEVPAAEISITRIFGVSGLGLISTTGTDPVPGVPALAAAGDASLLKLMAGRSPAAGSVESAAWRVGVTMITGTEH